jgi:molecular chaperone Hsp33
MTAPDIKISGDYLHRFTFEGLPVRGQWVRLTDTIAAANAVRDYPVEIKNLLNQMFAAVAMFADNLKFEGAVALQSRGNGALIRSLAECREHKYLRGIAHLSEEIAAPAARDDLAAWLNQGQLALSLIPPADTQQAPYQGLVPLEHATLAANLETYLENSEQLPSRLYLANTSDTVTGLLLQRLPSADRGTEISLAAEEDAWHTIVTLADTVTDEELLSLSPENMLSRLFAEYTCRLYPARELAYRCTCSRAKSDRTLRILDRQEVESLFAELGQIYVDCEFCGTRYTYDAVDIGELLNSPTQNPDPDIVH